MNYKLRNTYTTDPEFALQEILEDRGIKDYESYVWPRPNQELNPYDLENIEAAAQMILKHLRKNSGICFLVDCDADGFTSSAILWLYLKQIFPESHLSFTVHEHKQHGLEDKIDWLIEEEQFDLVICADSSSYDVECHKRLMEINTDLCILD